MNDLKDLIKEGKAIQLEGHRSSGYSLWRNDVESLIGDHFDPKTVRALNQAFGGNVIRTVRHEWDRERVFHEMMTSAIGFLERLDQRGVRSVHNNDQPKVHYRVEISGLTGAIATLVKELNSNLELENWYASALLVRRILTEATYLALKKTNRQHLLKDEDDNDVELNKALNICKNEFKLDNRVLSKVLTAKWIGDSANHSYMVKISSSDVETAVTGTRLLIEELGIGGD